MKICVMGPSGTGKTTVCKMLGEKFKIPYLHLDSVYWLKDWESRDKEDFNRVMKDYLTKNKSWVIDGNYSNHKHFQYRLDTADIIIFLDYGTKASLKGIYQREQQYKHRVRSDMAEGCVEKVDQAFLKFVAGYYKRRAKHVIAQINKQKHKKQVLIFKNRQELYEWYNSL